MNPVTEACALGAVFFGGHTLLATLTPADIAPWATAIAGGICTIAGALSWAYERFVRPRKAGKPRRRKPRLVPDTQPDRQAGGSPASKLF